MQFLSKTNVRNKRVIVRCDFNVPIENGVITDDSRITKSLETIKYLIDNNCKIVLLSHLGRIKTEEDRKDNSLKIVAQRLNELLDHKVTFLSECYGSKVKEYVDSMESKDVVLLENTRIMDLQDKLESNNDEELAKFWASLADMFIMDAFGSAHRAHASTAGIAKYIPACVGFLVEKELKGLNPLLNVKERPFVVFMGGAKVEDKLPIIKKLITKCDYILVGGGIANSFLKAMGEDVKKSLATSDEALLQELKDLLAKYKQKILLPIDFNYVNDAIMDVGEDTIKMYKHYISYSKLLFVNGTPGKFEDEETSKGTKKLFEICKSSTANVILGGGDTVSAAKKFGYENDFMFQSSGGGATLEYIANGKLEALEWIK